MINTFINEIGRSEFCIQNNSFNWSIQLAEEKKLLKNLIFLLLGTKYNFFFLYFSSVTCQNSNSQIDYTPLN